MQHTFQLVPKTTVITRYQLDSRIFESPEAFHELTDPDTWYYLHEGNLNINGHFVIELDNLPEGPDGKHIEGYIIDGDLHVSGNIINDIGDYGPVLYVAGNITCQSLLIGGAPTRVTGDIIAKEMILLHYNHGWMKCDGVFRAPVMVVNDYHLPEANKNITQFYYNDRDPEMPAENECQEDDNGDDVISPNLSHLLNDQLTTTFEEIQQDLAAGETVLAPVERDANWYLQRVQRNYNDLKRVPTTYKTPELCHAALQKGIGALKYFPQAMLTPALAVEVAAIDGMALRYLPDELITSELCHLAVKHGALLRSDIPEQFYDADIILQSVRYRDFQMEYVPVAYITEELMAEYVKIGRGAWLDRYCQSANISKERVLQSVIDSGFNSLEPVFSWHLSATTYQYAKAKYDTPEYRTEWDNLILRFGNKVKRVTNT
ncbi:hypothetical protein CLV59_10694 [Chitinophaga dinghuensis]|uniref:Uncharacterized protein n=1 Tax=Chitinophaga dinghuensis TaxID=1539050 RepID=A0A327VW27_9BACT|nr:polymer-forming cytoskeletal protein [Chitinophaga dinghuensis]RAJ79034.1 hypothetical protein CLV59_10694 [Chitinophaga dinghuensis]